MNPHKGGLYILIDRLCIKLLVKLEVNHVGGEEK